MIHLLRVLFLSGIIIQLSHAIKNCSCVVFRLDDVQDYNKDPQQKAVMQLFKDTNTSLSIGIVGNKYGEDSEIVNHVRNLYNNQSSCFKFEIASHGWNHEPFPSFNLSMQIQLMQNTQTKLLQMFGSGGVPKTFIPPYNNVNADTLTACRAVGFKVISSEVDQDPPPYPITGDFFKWPVDTATGDLLYTPDSHYVPVPYTRIFNEIQLQISKYGFSSVMIHPYEFCGYNETAHKYTTEVNQTAIYGLRTLIQMVKAAGLRPVTFDEVNEYFNESKVHPCTQTALPITSAPVTTASITSSPLTTSPLTTSPLTSSKMTTSPLTTSKLTTSPLTTSKITSAELSTADPPPLSSSALTSASLTSGLITSSAITSSAITSSKLTTARVTSSELTTIDSSKETTGANDFNFDSIQYESSAQYHIPFSPIVFVLIAFL